MWCGGTSTKLSTCTSSHVSASATNVTQASGAVGWMGICRPENKHTVMAEDEVSPLVDAQDRPHGPLGVAHIPAEEVGEVGHEGDQDRTVVVSVPRVGIPAFRQVSHAGEAAPCRCSMVLIGWGVVELLFS